MSLGIGLR